MQSTGIYTAYGIAAAPDNTRKTNGVFVEELLQAFSGAGCQLSISLMI
jgi:hypothetical protein